MPGKMQGMSHIRKNKDSDAVARHLLRSMAGMLVAEAKTRWPVDTGRSKASIRWTQPSGGLPQVEISARTPYTLYIISGGVHPWTAYILRPVRDLLDTAKVALARNILLRVKRT